MNSAANKVLYTVVGMRVQLRGETFMGTITAVLKNNGDSLVRWDGHKVSSWHSPADLAELESA